MTYRLASCVILTTVLTVSLSAQTIRIAPAARSPVTDADVLVLHEYEKSTGQAFGTMSMRYVTEIRQRAGALLDIAIVEPRFGGPSLFLTRAAALAASKPSVLSSAPSEPRLTSGGATFNALTVLRVQPSLGRDFIESDVESGRQLVILTDRGWRRVFGGRDDVIGRVVWTSQIGVPPRACEIVGVLPAAMGTTTPEIDPELDALLLEQMLFETPLPDESVFAPIVRLKPGVTLDAAKVAIDDAVAVAQRAIASPNYGGFGARLGTLRR